jgi:hypothetical protein
MRPSVLAVSLAAALLMPGVAALADPPRGRGQEYEYESGGCKYEYKGRPGGFKEEYKCPTARGGW